MHLGGRVIASLFEHIGFDLNSKPAHQIDDVSEVRITRPVVDETGPKQELSIDQRVAQIRIAAFLDPIENPQIDFVQQSLALACEAWLAKRIRNVPESYDTEIASPRLESWSLLQGCEESLSERDVASDQSCVSCGSMLGQ